jgi:hypothetical protein
MRQFFALPRVLSLVGLFLLPASAALAACTVPNTLTNGQTADATQVMANFNSILGCVNTAPAGSTGSGSVFNFTLMGAPAASQVLSFGVFTVPATYAAGLPEVIAAAGTAPTSAVSLSIKKNGTAIGSINWAAGAKSATVTFSSSVSFSVGDMLSIVAPATVDATFANITVMYIPVAYNVTSSRAIGGTYTNTTGRPVNVIVEATSGTSSTGTYDYIGLTANGQAGGSVQSAAANRWMSVTVTVQPGQSYTIGNGGTNPVLQSVTETY